MRKKLKQVVSIVIATIVALVCGAALLFNRPSVVPEGIDPMAWRGVLYILGALGALALAYLVRQVINLIWRR